MRKKIAAMTCAIALSLVTVSPAYADDGYKQTAVVPGLTATIEAPLPIGEAWYEAEDLPRWATLNPDGSIHLTPGEGVTPGVYEWPVRAVLADETERVFSVRVTISKDASTDLNLVVENALSVDLKLRDLNSRDVDLGIAAILAVAGLAGAGAIISQCVK